LKYPTLTIIVIFCCFSIQWNVMAQSSDSTELANLSAELDALFANEEDSLSLFSLIDSLLTIGSAQSGLSVRLGYSNRITTVGRDFGVDQQGVSPGISYYHKSGIYGDVTGVWNSELDPKYYLTIATIGYLGTIGEKWAYSTSYDHSFFHSLDSAVSFPLTNSLSGSITHDFKFLYTTFNYSYLFGNETAHQLAWNLTGVFKIKAFKPFKSISFMPTFSVLWGNQTLTYSSTVSTEDFIKNLSNEEIRTYFEKQSDRLSRADLIKRASSIVKLRNDLNEGTRLSRQQRSILSQFSNQFQTEVNSFGLLNYYISLPISFSANKFNIMVSYNYNIPKELPESVLEETASNGYFSFTFSYNIGF